MFKEVRRWLKEPSNFGFESGPWQLNLLLELIRRNFGLDCNMHMLRRWLCRIRISWRKNGHVSYRTASKREQKEFQQKAREQTRQKCATECVVFTEDEAAVQMQQNPAYSWMPTEGRGASKGLCSKLR